MEDKVSSPLFEHYHESASVFLPRNMLEVARIQKCLPSVAVPIACLLDFDGELLDYLLKSGEAELEDAWPCFYTKLYRWRVNDIVYGVIGGTIGAPFAVLVAEQLFALGCKALVSISSAGLIAADLQRPLFLVIDRALRDEGTSYHYRPSERFAFTSSSLLDAVTRRLYTAALPFHRGSSWTTDAPFRETLELIVARQEEGIIAVEMEAAALLAMGASLMKPVVCLAHITNSMATRKDDFEKGGEAGILQALEICSLTLRTALEHV